MTKKLPSGLAVYFAELKHQNWYIFLEYIKKVHTVLFLSVHALQQLTYFKQAHIKFSATPKYKFMDGCFNECPVFGSLLDKVFENLP
jgi:hypothetical protein